MFLLLIELIILDRASLIGVGDLLSVLYGLGLVNAVNFKNQSTNSPLTFSFLNFTTRYINRRDNDMARYK